LFDGNLLEVIDSLYSFVHLGYIGKDLDCDAVQELIHDLLHLLLAVVVEHKLPLVLVGQLKLLHDSLGLRSLDQVKE
jgi:hypothetical protein